MRKRQVANRWNNRARTCRIRSAYVSKRKVSRGEAAQYTERIEKGNHAGLLAWLDEEDRIERLGFGWIPGESDEITEHLRSIREDGVAAWEELAGRTRNLAPWIVREHFKAPMNDEQLEEMIEEAHVILMELIASGRYDPSRGSFAHYYKVVALPKLYKHYNESGVIRQDSEHVRVKNELEKACARFYQEHMREASYPEQADMLSDIMRNLGRVPRKGGYEVRDVAFYRGVCSVSSLDEPVGKGGAEYGALLEAPARIANEDEYQEAFERFKALVESRLAILGERDASIVLERGLDEEYREPLVEIARREGITKQRVSQICAEACQKMAAGDSGQALRDAARIASECAVWA